MSMVTVIAKTGVSLIRGPVERQRATYADRCPPPAVRPRIDCSVILIALGLGAVTGIFLGELVRPLEFVANGFVRLLQVNVLPYLLGSLVASLGSRGPAEMKVIARRHQPAVSSGHRCRWCCCLRSPGHAFSGAVVVGQNDVPETIDWLDLYIPSNLFRALSNNLIPSVVLFGSWRGLRSDRWQTIASRFC